eukprot:TRINITY_DN19919_c0_g1_i1.p2 TRINITY_DN19919_c0_g1~~TRINITY_DN19919_c0_g1_i1.p2  ORF type:complete len:304 (+),score=152.20 TRINITY_DN19919_c0_g1_i1:86-913(+)
MVLIHLKGDGERLAKEQSLYECVAAETKVSELTDRLTELQNARVRLRFMLEAAKQLRKRFEGQPEKAQTLDGPIQDATTILDLNQIEIYKKKVTLQEYQDRMEQLKGCAIIHYPAECTGRHRVGGKELGPVEWMCKMLEDEDCDDCDKWRMLLALVDDGARHEDMYNVGGCQLWWAGKQLHRDDLLSKYTGRNEKTKMVCKLTKQGGHAPMREPAINQEAQKDMMAWYYKKQEEQKKLLEDDDISHGNSAWADPRGLKNHFQGISGGIAYRPKLG